MIQMNLLIQICPQMLKLLGTYHNSLKYSYGLFKTSNKLVIKQVQILSSI